MVAIAEVAGAWEHHVAVADSMAGAGQEDTLLGRQVVALPEEYRVDDSRQQVGTGYRRVGLAGLAPLAEDDGIAAAAAAAVVVVAAFASWAGSRTHNLHTRNFARAEAAVVVELSIGRRMRVLQLPHAPAPAARPRTTPYSLQDSAAWAVAGVLDSWESE